MDEHAIQPESESPATPVVRAPVARTRWARKPAAPPFQLDRGNDVPAPSSVGVAFTRRAVILGSLLVAFVAAFTPYNDMYLKNTFFIGNHFPIGIFTIMAALVLLVNPALIRLGKRALGSGELIVIFSMMLVGAGAPTSGLMRYWESMLVAPPYHLKDFPWLKPIFALMPHWLVPTTDPNSKIVSNFMLGLAPSDHTPFAAFVVPALLWGVLIAAIFGATIFLAAIFRKQWTQYERLSYPLAALSVELLADPEPGFCYNPLWRNPLLWTGAAIPAFLYTLSGLHQFFPSVPYVSLYYHFRDAFTEFPWDHLPGYIPDNRIIFSAVGLTFFMPSEVAFSLWFFLLADGLFNVAAGKAGVDILTMMPVRSAGIYVAYFAYLVFIARRHLAFVFGSAFTQNKVEEGEFASYRVMVFGFLACLGVAWAWMTAVGVNAAVGLMVLCLGLMLFTLMTRIIAETGLFFLGTMWTPPQFLALLVGPRLVNVASYYWSAIVSRMFFMDMRETLMPFAANAMRMTGEIDPPRRRPALKWLFIALAISVVVSGLSQHVVTYAAGRNNMDDYSAGVVPAGAMTDTFAFVHGDAPTLGRSWLHFGGGSLMVAGVMIGRMFFVWWPFHPIGLLLMHTWPLQVFWFSIMVGWFIKQAILHYGGAFMYRRARPFFIGLIVGEMLTAGVWLLVGLASGGSAAFKMLPG